MTRLPWFALVILVILGLYRSFVILPERIVRMDGGVTVVTRGDKTVVVVHGGTRNLVRFPDAPSLEGWAEPGDVVEYLSRKELVSGREVVFISCYPGLKVPGEKSGVHFRWVNPTHEGLVSAWVTPLGVFAVAFTKMVLDLLAIALVTLSLDVLARVWEEIAPRDKFAHWNY